MAYFQSSLLSIYNPILKTQILVNSLEQPWLLLIHIYNIAG